MDCGFEAERGQLGNHKTSHSILIKSFNGLTLAREMLIIWDFPTLPKMNNLAQIAHQSNLSNLAYSSAILAILSGTTAGILGLESLYGFVFYLATAVIFTILVIYTRFQGKVEEYMEIEHFSGNCLKNLPSFVLFWVLFYGIVYVYE